MAQHCILYSRNLEDLRDLVEEEDSVGNLILGKTGFSIKQKFRGSHILNNKSALIRETP